MRTVFRVHQLSTTVARLRAEQETRGVLAHAGIPTVQPLAVFDGDKAVSSVTVTWSKLSGLSPPMLG
jgi:predicted TIM-barrel fold metal-dependent hydrolase